MRATRIRFPSVSPIAFKIKYTAIIDINPGNSPNIIAMFIYGFLSLNFNLDKQYETANV